jgi:hypothetical protein
MSNKVQLIILDFTGLDSINDKASARKQIRSERPQKGCVTKTARGLPAQPMSLCKHSAPPVSTSRAMLWAKVDFPAPGSPHSNTIHIAASADNFFFIPNDCDQKARSESSD